jgi:hypothetical protein
MPAQKFRTKIYLIMLAFYDIRDKTLGYVNVYKTNFFSLV